jgi:hypothetical protein
MVCAQVRIEIEPMTPHSVKFIVLPNVTAYRLPATIYQATPMIASEIGVPKAADD